jgi:hypothetical protein
MARTNPLSALSWGVAGTLVALWLPACGSSDVPIGENTARGTEGGAQNGDAGSPAVTSSGSAGASAAAGANPSGGSATGGQTQNPGGAATADAGESGLGGAGVAVGSCEATFADALVKDCTTADDCELVQHFDCCGNIVTAINSGAKAAFDAAEEAHLACVPGCELRGCFHADAAEDNKMLVNADDMFVAKCVDQRCTSTVTSPGRECTLDSDCGGGEVCVGFTTTVGPTSSTTYECHVNICSDVTAKCGCASSICTNAGFPLCFDSAQFQMMCDDGRQ